MDAEQFRQGGQLMKSLKNYALEVVDHVPPLVVHSIQGFDILVELLDNAAGFREHSELKRSLHKVLSMPQGGKCSYVQGVHPEVPPTAQETET